MHHIWKFEIPVDDEVVVETPLLTSILHIGSQPDPTGRDKIYLWAVVEKHNAERYSEGIPEGKFERTFRVIGTGHPIDDYEILDYIGTAHLSGYGSPLVFHVFEKIDREQSEVIETVIKEDSTKRLL